jgi:cytochrome c oxidase subunit I+III
MRPGQLPSRLPRPAGELERLQAAWEPPRGWRAISGVNNVTIGKLYIATAMLFLLLGGLLALLMRAQLAAPNLTLLSASTYNQVFTMHGTVMMFLFAVPVVEAVAVYLLPGMLGARDLPFPRLSAYAFWAYAIGGLAFFCTLFAGLAPDGGWFMYPPLSGIAYSPGLNADFWLLGIGFIEISAIAGAIELIIGILMTRAPGMSLARMPVYAWAMLIVGVMIVFAFPAVIAGTALLEMERAFDWPIFDATRGGDPLLWQHLFWFFGHPEVYIIFLPAAGMVSAMVPAMARTPLLGQRAIVVSLLGVGLLSFALWAHHMFTAGLGSLSLSLVSLLSLAVAVPGCVQVFAWIGSLWRGRPVLNTATLFMLGFLFSFVIGGLTGVMLAVLPFDWQMHDSYFVVAHLHYVLIGGVLFPVFAATYYWWPLFKGHRLGERWGRWVFGLVFGGFHLCFFPMHLAGLRGMPRRVYSYESGLGWELPNLLSSLGAALLGLGVLLLLIDILRSLGRPQQETGDPWRAPTLEWLPTGWYGTRSIPQIDGPDPLWHRPTLAEEVEAGAHWLPGSVTGGRETLVTSAIHAQPRHLIIVPGDSLWPLLAALGTAGFFLLLTVKWTGTAAACGLLAIVSVIVWLWQTDRAPAEAEAEVADRVWLPIRAHGRASHAWWAVVILLIVDATVLASFGFAHLHVAMRLDICPPPGAALPSLRDAGLVTAGFVLSAALIGGVGQGVGRRPLGWPQALLLLPALVLSAGAFEWLRHAHADLLPSAEAWSATLAALLAYQGLHIVLLVLLAAYLGARIGCGLVTPRQRSTLENTQLLWWWTCAQGVLVCWWPYLVSASMA